MTLSEIHAVMTGGFATIAGTVLGAFISFGVGITAQPLLGELKMSSTVMLIPTLALQIDASSLISASVMAAPCALALSKLVYPEIEESKFKSEEGVKLSRG
jgi:pyrimidine nucleoside transport protein